ncbi:MAG: hypothetical protein ACJ754_20840 [Pyrinomonadaceae bacterium]
MTSRTLLAPGRTLFVTSRVRFAAGRTLLATGRVLFATSRVLLVAVSGKISLALTAIYSEQQAGAAPGSKKVLSGRGFGGILPPLNPAGASNRTASTLPTLTGEELKMPKIKLNFGNRPWSNHAVKVAP